MDRWQPLILPGEVEYSMRLLVLDTLRSQFAVVRFTRSSGLARHRGEVSCFAECGVASPRKFR